MHMPHGYGGYGAMWSAPWMLIIWIVLIGQYMQYPNQVFAREHLIELLWGIDSETEGRTINSHIRNMRDKIRQTGFPIDTHLQIVWGIGYKWVNEVEVDL